MPGWKCTVFSGFGLLFSVSTTFNHRHFLLTIYRIPLYSGLYFVQFLASRIYCWSLHTLQVQTIARSHTNLMPQPTVSYRFDLNSGMTVPWKCPPCRMGGAQTERQGFTSKRTMPHCSKSTHPTEAVAYFVSVFFYITSRQETQKSKLKPLIPQLLFEKCSFKVDKVGLV